MTRIIYILFIVLVLFSCKESTSPIAKADHIVKVKTQIIHEKEFFYSLQSGGRIVSDEELKLSFKMGGIVDQINVREGQKVKAGQILARLNLSEIEATVKQAQLGLEKAKRDFSRIENLYKDSVTTLEQYQNAKTALEVAGYNLEIARFNLTYSVIRAPSQGTVLKILVEENEMTGSGYPVLLFGSTEKTWVVKTSVTDKQIVALRLGDKAQIYSDAFPENYFEGFVSEISQFADPYTGTYEIKIQLNPLTQKLVSGMIVNCKIRTREKTRVYPVPYESVVNADVKSGYIYKVLDGNPVREKVEIFMLQDDSVLLSRGVNSGDEIITENVNYLKDGSKIQIVK